MLRLNAAAARMMTRLALQILFSGAAWTGETDVTEIAVSTDGGRTWAQAEFLDL
jgi:hypothetical protein